MCVHMYYVLDEQDRFVDCGGNWLDFAVKNGGSADRLAKAKLKGRGFTDMVKGFQTRTYFSSIFSTVRRSGETFVTYYRCDSLSEARMFEMTVSLQGQLLHVGHDLLWVDPILRPDEKVDPAKATLAPCCTVCGSYAVEGEWVDPLDHPEKVLVPDQHTVCSGCRDALVARLASGKRPHRHRIAARRIG